MARSLSREELEQLSKDELVDIALASTSVAHTSISHAPILVSATLGGACDERSAAPECVAATDDIQLESATSKAVHFSRGRARSESLLGEAAADAEAKQVTQERSSRETGLHAAPWGVLLPPSRSKQVAAWEALGVVCLVLTAFELPFRIAFGDWYSIEALRSWSKCWWASRWGT